jgi:hypothetical protein
LLITAQFAAAPRDGLQLAFGSLLPPSANSMLSNLNNRIRLRKAPTAMPEG